MHRAVLEACLPCLIALAVSLVALRLLVKFSGARFQWRRLKEVHTCQEGGVQSLAFVMTLPMFLVITQFIVQVNQLMTGVMAVNYAAYASARSAAVWFPAAAGDFGQNKLGMPITEGNSVLLTSKSNLVMGSVKYQQTFKAAALACGAISPSRGLGYELDETNSDAAAVTRAMYAQLVPDSQNNGRINKRIDNKLAWSYRNTSVRISFVDKDTRKGPTYNPRMPVYDQTTGTWTRDWDPHEIGWQDPVTCTVTHEFALLPGPGRFLAKYLVRADGQPDNIPERIKESQGPSREKVYTTKIWATATATVEGMKSVVPYDQTPQ